MNREREDLPELDPNASALLEAFRHDERFSDDVEARVWESVRAQLAARRVRTGAAIVASVAIAACILLFVRGPAFLAMGGNGQAQQAEYTADAAGEGGMLSRRSPAARPSLRASRTPTADDSSATSRQEEESPPTAREQEMPEPVTRPPTPARSKNRSQVPLQERDASDSLARESKHLRAVQRALAVDDANAALKLLDAWALEVPRGVLQAEREGLRAVALCESGAVEAGVAVRHAFERRWPESPLRKRIEVSCDGTQR